MARSIRYLKISEPSAKTSRGRVGKKKRETSQRIFLAAVELMRTKDFDGVSVDEICERADVARATFFQHFASKAAIYGVASEIACQRIEEELAAEKMSAEDQLSLVVNHMERLSTELGAAAPQMFAAFTAEPGGGFRMGQPESGIEAIIVKIVRRGQANGALSKRWTPEEVAISLVSSWIGAARYRLSHPGAKKRSAFASVLELLLNGLKPR